MTTVERGEVEVHDAEEVHTDPDSENEIPQDPINCNLQQETQAQVSKHPHRLQSIFSITFRCVLMLPRPLYPM